MRKDGDVYTGKQCAVKGCEGKVPASGHFFCQHHWFRIDSEKRREILAAFRGELTRGHMEKTKAELTEFQNWLRTSKVKLSYDRWRKGEYFKPCKTKLDENAWAKQVKKAAKALEKGDA